MKKNCYLLFPREDDFRFAPPFATFLFFCAMSFTKIFSQNILDSLMRNVDRGSVGSGCVGSVEYTARAIQKKSF